MSEGKSKRKRSKAKAKKDVVTPWELEWKAIPLSTVKKICMHHWPHMAFNNGSK